MSDDKTSTDRKLTEEDLRVLQANLAGKRFPVDLNIKKFKQYLTQFNLTKTQRNALIKQYKEQAWQDYDTIVNYKGSAPTHRVLAESEKNGE